MVRLQQQNYKTLHTNSKIQQLGSCAAPHSAKQWRWKHTVYCCCCCSHQLVVRHCVDAAELLVMGRTCTITSSTAETD